MTIAPRPHRMMPVSKPAASPENIKAASELYASPARKALKVTPKSFKDAPAPKPEARKPAPFYVNVYQLSPGRHFLGAASAGPIYSQHAVYRLRVTLKVPA